MPENVSNKNSSIHLIPPTNLVLLFNQFNNISPDQNADPEKVVNSTYSDIDEIQKQVSIFLPYKYVLNGKLR